MCNRLFCLTSIFLFFTFTFSCPVIPAESDASDTILRHLQTAKEFFEQSQLDAAEVELKKILEMDKSNAEAYHLLARIYLKSATPNSRTKAVELMYKAIECMPENIEYHTALANIFVEQGFRENAVNYLERLAKKYPQNPDVMLCLGNFYREDVEQMHTTVSSQNGGLYDENTFSAVQEYGGESVPARRESYSATPDLDLGKFRREALNKAKRVYKNLHTLQPHYKDVDRQLAMLAYNENNWKEMIEYATDFKSAYPDDRNSYLLLGLAYQRQGDYKNANSAFHEFSKRILPDERAYCEQFDQFLSEEQQESIKKMDEQKKSKYHKDFWFSRDPLYLTEYNERALEHYARIAEALLLFSAPKYNVEGWKTDRGLIWVRYGPPIRKVKNLNIKNVGRPLQNYLTQKRTLDSEFHREFWYYDFATFIFYEFPPFSGISRFFNMEGLSFSDKARDLECRIPDYFEMKVRRKKHILPYYAVDFRGKEGKTHINLYYGIPMSSLRFAADEGEFVARIEHGIFMFDHDWNEVIKEVETAWHIEKTRVDPATNEFLVLQNRFDINPGSYNVSIEFKDDSSGNIGVARDSVDIEVYGYETLQLSDILFASSIEPEPSAVSISIDELNYRPNVTRVYSKTGRIYLYFEIYNLKLTGFPGKTEFQVEYEVEMKSSPENKIWAIGKVIGRLFSFSRNKFELATSAEYSGSTPVENLYLELDSHVLESGTYQLTITVTDKIAGQSIEKSSTFHIID